ncbi:FecR family protein [Flexithrix dorotheae]|uniref:FecR family protein n=1 Tax=Flexithrix dorotheae TaxID=70993 RepID=UPI0003672F33|nr:FecR family protein [Flexithrix dorotheae]
MLKRSKYKDYNLEAFLNDSFFVEWVINKDSKNNFFWVKWISNHPEKLEVVSKAKAIISSVEYKVKYQRNEKDFIEVLENILDSNENQGIRKLRKENGNKSWLKYAAVILLLLASGIFFWKNFHQDTQTSFAETPVITTKKTTRGQKMTLILNDGTEVKLNAETKLTYAKGFSPEKREVFLEGEAFFDVSKDTLRPFIIHSGSLSTRVLGTSFNVKAYPNQEQITVAVVSGKVQVVKKQKSDKAPKPTYFNLTPNEALVYEKSNEAFKKQKVKNINAFIAWKNNHIIFEKSSFPEIVMVLERFYDVDFELKKKVVMGEKGLFTGEYNNEPLKNILESLSYAGDFKFEIKKSKVIIY